MTKPDFQTRTFVFLERLWLIAAALGVICVVVCLILKYNDDALFFFLFFILSSVIYLMRKRQRVRHQSYLKFKDEAGQKKEKQ